MCRGSWCIFLYSCWCLTKHLMVQIITSIRNGQYVTCCKEQLHAKVEDQNLDELYTILKAVIPWPDEEWIKFFVYNNCKEISLLSYKYNGNSTTRCSNLSTAPFVLQVNMDRDLASGLNLEDGLRLLPDLSEEREDELRTFNISR